MCTYRHTIDMMCVFQIIGFLVCVYCFFREDMLNAASIATRGKVRQDAPSLSPIPKHHAPSPSP